MKFRSYFTQFNPRLAFNYVILLFVGFLLFNCAEKNKTFTTSEISIIPKPLKIELSKESFDIKEGISILAINENQKAAAKILKNSILAITGKNLQLVTTKQNNAIQFKQKESIEKEGYNLQITPKQIIIEANDDAGYFYGVQSIIQLLSKNEINSSAKWLLPSVKIDDVPRFKWRAYMLDESRYFMGEDFVKLILDQMAILKMNTFHWHLTDDAGWRIEIKKYPRLTEIGSKRTDSEVGTWKSGKTSGKPHSGFYSQEQIKNIVKYAAQRHITIIPEIEMPGHASAAIAAYNWLGTAKEKIEVPIVFGRHYDNYDVTQPQVLEFIQDVLKEIFQLFPSEVIHIGGDEVGYKVWEDSKHVQKYMNDNNIETPADLQIDFVNKISQFLAQNGRRMMGWNEIMGTNIHKGFTEKKNDKDAKTQLAKNIVVHFWKGDIELAKKAAINGYGIVNSLHSSTYLDYNYKSIDLEKAYNFDPIPEGLEKDYHKFIYGLGCQMWTEWTPTSKEVEYQTFPRIAAYAEVGWTTSENKNFENFKIGLNKMQQDWKSKGINYAKLPYEDVKQ